MQNQAKLHTFVRGNTSNGVTLTIAALPGLLPSPTALPDGRAGTSVKRRWFANAKDSLPALVGAALHTAICITLVNVTAVSLTAKYAQFQTLLPSLLPDTTATTAVSDAVQQAFWRLSDNAQGRSSLAQSVRTAWQEYWSQVSRNIALTSRVSSDDVEEWLMNGLEQVQAALGEDGLGVWLQRVCLPPEDAPLPVDLDSSPSAASPIHNRHNGSRGRSSPLGSIGGSSSNSSSGGGGFSSLPPRTQVELLMNEMRDVLESEASTQLFADMWRLAVSRVLALVAIEPESEPVARVLPRLHAVYEQLVSAGVLPQLACEPELEEFSLTILLATGDAPAEGGTLA